MAPESIRNDDVHHEYRQDSDLYYLTGFEEPECVLILVARPGAAHRSILFLRERDPQREIWDGYRLGVDDAPSTLGIDEARSVDIGLRYYDRLVVVLLHQLCEIVPEHGDGQGDHDDAAEHRKRRDDLAQGCYRHGVAVPNLARVMVARGRGWG